MEMAMGLESDLTQLDDLSVSAIQDRLRERYNRDLIYTKVSDILIAINPCKPLPIYDTAHHEQNRWDNFSGDAAPHVFNVAATAYRRMRETETDQVIIVSGESGSGKTESTKYMVRHMVHMCQEGQMELHDKIVKVNPLLESFGNAKTLMNRNSSRFAKYLELRFDRNDGMLRGAVVRDYMLEKSRVVHQNQGEGIFHIFYALFAGCSKDTRTDLFLTSQAGEYRIMKSDVESLDMEDYYRQVYKENMDILKQINVDTDIVHSILASVINVADIEFQESDKGNAEIVDAAPYCHAAILLDLSEENLGHSLITSKRVIRGQEIVTYKTVKQAEDARDALAKILYERMFGWLVRQINIDLHTDRSHDYVNIGILDIAGFEKLRKNSFEQMCINIVNEKLQSFMNKQIFTTEIEIYKSEGILLEGINFKNNEDILELFEKPKIGVLAILDETTRFQQGSDLSFVQQLNEKYGTSSLYTKAKGDRPEFGIKHFAAQVWYDAQNFLEKNRDRLNDEIMEVLKASGNEFISDLFTVKRGPTGTISREVYNYRASKKPQVKTGIHHNPRTPNQGKLLAMELGKSIKKRFGTVGPPSDGITQDKQTAEKVTLTTYFQQSLLDLLGKIGNGEPFFVRCLKANGDLLPDKFDNGMVADQLSYNGIAAIAKIRKMGFAVRKSYTDFLRRYQCLHKALPTTESNREKTRCILLLTPATYHRDFRCGRTKVFMTDSVELWLEKVLSVRQNAASRTISRCIRRFLIFIAIKRKQEEEERKKKAAEDEKRRKEKDSPPPYNRNPPPDEAAPGGSGSGMTSSIERPGPSGIGTFNLPDESPVYHHPPSPPLSHDPEPEPEDTQKKAAETKEFWDICQIIARERTSKDVHEQRSMQVIKVITYILLFCILLWCAVAQKVALVILAADQHNATIQIDKTYPTHEDWLITKAGRYYLMAIAIMIPYGLTLVIGVLKWIFGNFLFPKATTLLWCWLIEGLHSAGLCLLCFDILPELNMPRGLMILSGVAIMPAILKPVFSSEAKLQKIRKTSNRVKICIFLMDLLVLLIQWGYIPLVLTKDFFYNHGVQNYDHKRITEYVCAMILISFSWWENFVDNRFFGKLRSGNFWYRFIMSVKFDLQESRPVISVFMSLWKIGVTCLMCWILGLDEDISEYFGRAFEKLGQQPFAENASILTLTLAAFVGHYVGYTACKLRLQRFSYDIPLILSTPLAVLVVSLQCQGFDVLTPFTDEKLEHGCLEFKPESEWWHYLCGLAALLSLYWIGRHIFFPNIERLAKTERLFLNPYYCGILFEQHMILNRRRHNRKVYREFKDEKTYYRLSDYDTTINVEGEEEEAKSTDAMSEDTQSETYQNPKFRDVPMIYACATMWHENRLEMLQLMKSLFRMDRDQCLRKHAEILTGKPDSEFYDFEAHIFFDDAMEENDNGEWVPNQFVKLMMTVLDEAASCVYEKHMKVKPPVKIPSPYGGQLIWTMPGDNFLYLHLKDKQKIRHRKRWSQVMYMYYLLGYRIVRHCQETVTAALNENRLNELVNWEERQQLAWGQIGKSHIFRIFDDQVLRKASNTFLLALDGDVDFTPGAVRLLLDRMRKSEKVGASCGRIHPIGTGPIVWFQKFEYAIAHWLQKATEHVLGCVLCSPGCFSLFRGSALMDDNVMKKYTILPTEPAHHLMYDQGEDRWLCTLLLQQGYRVDYAAGSDAFTYAPEGFAEFFNQRRRWMPSTVANIVDLLADYKNTIYVNSNVSMLYIFYQAGLLISTVVGPATVLMMIAGANLIVFGTTLIGAYLIAICPAVLYFVLCFILKPKWQIMAAEVLSAFYAFVMMIVFVGTIVTAAQESLFHPSVVFIVFLVFLFSFAAVLHPKEWTCALYGVLYFLCIPTGFLLLVFYSLVNLHVVSWGTREVPKKKTKEEIEAEKQKAEEKKKKKKEQGFFGRLFPTAPLNDFKELLQSFTAIQGEKKHEDTESIKLLRDIREGINSLAKQTNPGQDVKITIDEDNTKPHTIMKEKEDDQEQEKKGKGILKKQKHVEIADKVSVQKVDTGEISEENIYDRVPPKRDDLKNPAWIETQELGKGSVMFMVEEERNFWEGFVSKYLKPLVLSDEQKKNMKKGLVELRNNVCLGMAMINILWIAINFMFQLSQPTKINIRLSENQNPETEEEEDQQVVDNYIKVDILGLLFIIFFLVILLLQFVGMIIHRWGTFLHLVSVTELRNPFKKVTPEDAESAEIQLDSRTAMKVMDKIISEPLPDYPSDEDSDEEDDEAEREEEIRRVMTTGSRFNFSVGRQGVLGASSRFLGTTDRELTNDERVNLVRSAKWYRGDIQKGSRFDRAPARDEFRRALQDDFLKKKDNKYKDRALPPIKENKFHLGPSKQNFVSRLRERDLDRRLGIEDRRSRPLIEEDIYDTIPIPKRGTIGRAIGKKMSIMAKGKRNGRPLSVGFNLGDPGRPGAYNNYGHIGDGRRFADMY